MNKSSLDLHSAQPLFDACFNPHEKGNSQYFTPVPFGRACAALLPKHRPVVVDLTCGRGDLLEAAVNPSTTHLLGSDVDAGPWKQAKEEHPTSNLEHRTSKFPIRRIVSEVSALGAALDEVEWRADAFALNPPYGLSFKPERLAFLKDSDLNAVASTFDHQPSTLDKHGGIDSTAALIALALHFCSREGEGFAICNHATVERLFFAQGAPFALLGRHVWLRVVLPGNPMTGELRSNFDKEYNTEVVYFAKAHTTGPERIDTTQAEWESGVPEVRGQRSEVSPLRVHRLGADIRGDWQTDDEPLKLWNAVAEEVGVAAGRAQRHPWNAWLHEGIIRTNLTPFQTASRKVDKKLAETLHSLNGKRPMELVLQRNRRNDLVTTIEAGGWRVQPELAAAVTRAINEYHSGRAPLYPLPEIQRLGYLDESDFIVCKETLYAAP